VPASKRAIAVHVGGTALGDLQVQQPQSGPQHGDIALYTRQMRTFAPRMAMYKHTEQAAIQ
jgi:hypothetical protein